MRNKQDLVWQIMLGACAVIIIGGGWWCTTVWGEIQEISKLKTTVAVMERNVAQMQEDIGDIKKMVSYYLRMNP